MPGGGPGVVVKNFCLRTYLPIGVRFGEMKQAGKNGVMGRKKMSGYEHTL